MQFLNLDQKKSRYSTPIEIFNGIVVIQDPNDPSIGLTVRRISTGTIREMPSSVSQGCKHLILSLLRLDPGERPYVEDIRKRNNWVLKSTAAFLYRTQMTETTTWKIKSVLEDET